MPIPTRSTSLRDPKKPASSIARPTTATNSKLQTRPATSSSLAPSATEAASKDVGIPRGRTLLPQPSQSARDDAQGLGPARLPQPESRLPQRGSPSPKRQPQVKPEAEKRGIPPKAAPGTAASGPTPTRRQSLMRPTSSKMSSVKSNVPASRPTSSTTAPSTQRQIPPRTAAPRPPSPKKTGMPPPPRPVRSASLRQPVGVTPPPPAAARGHARHRSQLAPATTKQATDLTSADQKPRPGFSTYQQHYSPRKATKPPTPTPGQAPESDNLLIPCSWPDITALQVELLQLSLFHSNQLQRQAEWISESESRLQEQYEVVASQYQTVLRDEKRRQQKLNTQALGYWAQNCHDHNGPHGFPEQVQTLSHVLQDISDLVDSEMGGCYAQVVATFEDWIEVVGEIRRERESSGIMSDLVFIDPLDGSWKEDVQGLQAKLELSLRQLQSLDILGFGDIEQLEQSALTRVAIGLRKSLQLMLQEVRAMHLLEAEVVGSERETVHKLATQLSMDKPAGAGVREGIWRSGRV